MTPFEAIYGQNPPSMLSYLPQISKVHEVEKPSQLGPTFSTLSRII